MSALSVAIRARVGRFDLDVAFDTEAQVTAVIGSSGAGKSLTLRAIAGLLRPEAGRIAQGLRVWFDSARKVDVPARERRVGLVFQGYALFPHLDVADNIGFGLHRWTKDARRARIAELATLVELDGRLGASPSELSGGQQQRVAIARALAPRPDLLLLDEPFAAVDPALRRRLRDGLRDLLGKEGVRSVLVTHDATDAAALAQRVVVVEAGRCVAVGGLDLLDRGAAPEPRPA